jgi:hypothetical protein
VAKIMQMLAPLFHSSNSNNNSNNNNNNNGNSNNGNNSNNSNNNNNNNNNNSNNNNGLPLLAPESFDDNADDGLRATAVEIDRAESFLFGYEGATLTTLTTTLFSQPVSRFVCLFVLFVCFVCLFLFLCFFCLCFFVFFLFCLFSLFVWPYL